MNDLVGSPQQLVATHLTTCSNTNNMKFNESKCKVLTVSRKKKLITFAYHLGSTNLHHVQEEKDLGVIMTGNLSWNSHVHSITSKANKLLGLLRRTCPPTLMSTTTFLLFPTTESVTAAIQTSYSRPPPAIHPPTRHHTSTELWNCVAVQLH